MTSTADHRPASWYVVRTNPRCEARAKASLEAEGFVTYLPTMRYEFRHKRTKMWVERTRSLFTGYLFLGMPGIRHWGVVRQCDGVAKVLEIGGNPVPIGANLVDGVRRDQEAGRFDVMRRSSVKRMFTAGQRALIAAGPMAGLEVVVEAHRNSREVKVIADFISATGDVIVNVDNLRDAA
ncbi:transcription termination/antitermination protein NusG [Jiella avicenniae]|uniref:NusG-like N-terminal domain-containing protein n=1 Tax=Jiella avicenniae TaxID=2907202 RepID=A0A9X1NZF0_9HYPH|nr:transcription termination/antitermination NusG family protein [Jiella avicenniae]MCE7028462.1 hypothetical protein [Jiella avicenniae]